MFTNMHHITDFKSCTVVPVRVLDLIVQVAVEVVASLMGFVEPFFSGVETGVDCARSQDHLLLKGKKTTC